MLERILSVKPGIERTVNKYSIRPSGALRRKTKGNAGKRPYPVHDDPVEAIDILTKPAPQSRRKCIPSQIRLTKSMHRAWNTCSGMAHRDCPDKLLRSPRPPGDKLSPAREQTRVDLHPPGKNSELCEVYAWNLHFGRRGFGNGGPSRALDRHPVPKAQHDWDKTSRIPIARDKTPRT